MVEALFFRVVSEGGLHQAHLYNAGGTLLFSTEKLRSRDRVIWMCLHVNENMDLTVPVYDGYTSDRL
jgi:hypothetical protein